MKIKNYSDAFSKKILSLLILLLFAVSANTYSQTILPLVPPEWRGTIDAERQGTHDANLIRTLFYNYGMVGDYPADPLNVDLSIFHSVEIPKGSGENYSDGTTPFVLAKVIQTNGNPAYIMLTGYRERQGTSPITNKTMRFEPRFGYFQINPDINKGRSPAISNDPRTWPDEWYDKLNDPDDPGWRGSWNGYFGKAPKADQESFCVYDDNYYDAWAYYPDSRDNTRRGLGLRVEQRGFQWANPQAGYVIFFHYDISNESTTSYNNNVIFGLYMDSGVGGSAIGRDGIPESDDDNAFFDKEAGLNLVYTWDKNGNGYKGPTGYLGYSYLETPGNPFDVIDNDDDGITDERRDGGPGQEIIGQQAILNYVSANYDLNKFRDLLGDITKRPAYLAGVWWTGDEDLDWIAEFHDTGADGIFGTNDSGEKDGKPTLGEPYFDKTDIDESDQIGLTGFKMNRIRAGAGNPSSEVDQIVFFDDGKQWPKRLYENIFTNPDSAFGTPVALNYNIGFLFASGPFILEAGKTERFSLAMGFGQNLRELRVTTKVVQQIYKANYQFAVPPPMPTVQAFAGDGFVTLTWDNAAERAFDPITNENDFEGYRIYRSTDPTFLDPQVIYTGTGTRPIGNGKPIAQFDLKNEIYGFSQTTVEGVAYFLGEDTGLKHTFTDTTVVNGQKYYYAVCAYDRGVDSVQVYPSENSITVSQTLRGGIILPKNVVEVIPNPPVVGYQGAETFNLVHSEGRGSGSVSLQVLNSRLVPDNHSFSIQFYGHEDSVAAEYYRLIDVTSGDTLFNFGNDFNGEGSGPAGSGILPIIKTNRIVQIDSANTGLVSSSSNAPYKIRYSISYPIGYKRIGFPEDIDIIFSDTFIDTSVVGVGAPSRPVKFTVIAKTLQGDQKLKFRFRSTNAILGLPVNHLDYIEILTAPSSQPTQLRPTWRLEVDTTGLNGQSVIPPTLGDVYRLRLIYPFSSEDKYTFITKGQSLNSDLAKQQFSEEPYVVPNPYVAAASFEPQRFAVMGRGERKIEFRNLPVNCTIRIYTLNGELVQTLKHDGNINKGFVEWNLRNSDQLEVAPGLYIYHVDGGDIGTYIGKFAIIK
ncbi:Hypothetical protein IALB_1180 [Ignavibacterium album JCM 16511]|uniref:Fibronectin type III domain protein n=1 Tax=Ignavibacterium album (strain DSM 19864 / JCM 16511 / NBRC 101810 / Mat9-16) TaxID=945713 RepID=I0AIT4_IGNAJ|nr:hypothetical protein [Ignavibacterium album]AFH48891.1 Hypothetical protein IALB_1180 [Ignavibacterium album JCM 16511]